MLCFGTNTFDPLLDKVFDKEYTFITVPTVGTIMKEVPIMRVSKKYDVRLTEILDAAEALFSQIGYEKTTINNILEKVGIGKGTFYHYFQSKEELGDAVVARIVDYIATSVDTARSKPAINAHEKMIATLYALRINENPHT